MNQRDGHKHVRVARYEDLVDLSALARCFPRSASEKCWPQAQGLAYPVVNVCNTLDLLIGPRIVAFDSLIKQLLELALLFGTLS